MTVEKGLERVKNLIPNIVCPNTSGSNRDKSQKGHRRNPRLGPLYHRGRGEGRAKKGPQEEADEPRGKDSKPEL